MPPRKSTRQNPIPTPTAAPPMDSTAIESMIAQRVADALANYEANRHNGTGHGTASSSHGNDHANPRVCTYKDFQNCKPRSFHGNEGAIGLTRWIEKTESVFQISFCPEDCKVRFAASTFADTALTWWNSHTATMGLNTANAMSWEELKLMLVEEYCPRNEVQNLEQEFWNLSMKGSDIAGYTQRFNELATLSPGMVTPEYKKIERYIWGLAPQIQGMVTASRPTTFDSAKRIATHLTTQAIRQGTMTPKNDPPARGGDKRKYWSNNRGNSQQFPRKKQETGTAYAAPAPANRNAQKTYGGDLPRCKQCGLHHTGGCATCFICHEKGHVAKFCKKPIQNPGGNTGGGYTCYECGRAGHIRRNFPKLGNQARTSKPSHSPWGAKRRFRIPRS